MYEINENASPVRHRIPPWLQSPERRLYLAEFCEELLRVALDKAKEKEARQNATEEVETNV